MATLPLTRMQRFIALSADLIKLVARGSIPHAELDAWNHALQLMKERRLGYALARSSDLADAPTRHRLYNELMEDLPFLSQRDKRLMRQIGVRYVAELYLVDCTTGSASDTRRAARILDAFWHHFSIPRDINPLTDRWTPIYWGDGSLRQLLNLPVLDLIGDHTQAPDASLPLPPINRVGITSEARLFHASDCHWSGQMLQSMQAGGRNQLPTLAQLKRAQKHLRRTRLWARFVVPGDWSAPEGIPACWTEIFEKEIRLLQENESVRRASEDTSLRDLAAWQALCEQRAVDYRLHSRQQWSPSDSFDITVSDLVDDETIHPGIGVVLNRAGVSTLGQLLQILPEELDLLLRAYGSMRQFPLGTFQSLLMTLGRIPYPLVLSDEDQPRYPIPDGIKRLRAHLQSLEYPNLTFTDKTILRPHFLLLIQPPNALAMPVRVITRIHDSQRYPTTWQLCQATGPEMTELFGSRRRPLQLLDESLKTVGLRLGCQFSAASKDLLRSTSVDSLLEIMYSSAPA